MRCMVSSFFIFLDILYQIEVSSYDQMFTFESG